jgi:outer membrane murein-binding lipoprotein Lpp
MSQKNPQELQALIEALTRRVASLESQVKALQQDASRAIQQANRSGARK